MLAAVVRYLFEHTHVRSIRRRHRANIGLPVHSLPSPYTTCHAICAPNISVFLQRLISGEVSLSMQMALHVCGFQSHGHNHLLMFPLIVFPIEPLR